MSKSNLNSLKLTFINQSEYFFMLLNKNEKTNKIFTSFYYNLSKKFIKLQPIKSIELTVKYTNNHYNKIMSFDEEFYNNLDLSEIFLSNDDEDDVYYKDWFTKIKNFWFDISQPEKIELIPAFQCMILTASKYYLIANS